MTLRDEPRPPTSTNESESYSDDTNSMHSTAERWARTMRTIAHSLGLTNHFGSDTHNTLQKESLGMTIICQHIMVNPSCSLTAHASGDDYQLVINRQNKVIASSQHATCISDL